MSFPADCAARFRPDRRLAQGGFGTVWRATQIGLERPVAVKLLDSAGDKEAIARFRREARVTADLDHPNIVRVIDHGCDSGTPWLALEFVEGMSVRKRLESGPVAPALALEIAAQVAAGLACAHAKGVLHRDVKPENVLESEGHFKLADFGIATFASAESSIQTHAGVVLGTPAYISPEQISGTDASPASDLYALGCMLFELLTGEVPFPGHNVSSILESHLRHPPPPAGVSPAVDRLVAQLLAKDPAARPASASQVSDDLRALAADGTFPQRVPGRPRVVSGAVQRTVQRTVPSAVSSGVTRGASMSLAVPPQSASASLAARVAAMAAVIGACAGFWLATRPRPAPILPPTPVPSESVVASGAAFPPGRSEAPWAGTPLEAPAAKLEALLAERRARYKRDEAALVGLGQLVGTAISILGGPSKLSDTREVEAIQAVALSDLERAVALEAEIAAAAKPHTDRAARELLAAALETHLVLWHQTRLTRARLDMYKRMLSSSTIDSVREAPYPDLPDGVLIYRRFAQLMVPLLRELPGKLTFADVRFLELCDLSAFYVAKAIEHARGNDELSRGSRGELQDLHRLATTHEAARYAERVLLIHAGYRPDGSIRFLSKPERTKLVLDVREQLVGYKKRAPEARELDALISRFHPDKFK